jgi:hypothetical protein
VAKPGQTITEKNADNFSFGLSKSQFIEYGRFRHFTHDALRRLGNMKTAMRNLSESQTREKQEKLLTERKRIGESLLRGLIQRPHFGKGIEEAYNKHPDRVMNLAFAIKNVEEHLQDLTESQISSTLGTTPENVMRVLRLGYLNTCRQDAFWEMGLATAHDIFFYLEPKYKKTLRGADAGDVMYQSKSGRSASDEGEWASAETPNGTLKIFTFAPTAAELPLTPYTVRVYKKNNLVANDNGKGIITGSDVDGTAITGTVNYATGAGSVTFITASATGEEVVMSGSIALENDNDLQITQSAELSLRSCAFNLREYPITTSFSKKLELTLGTSYKVDAQEAYLRAMADELRKTLDIQAFTLASRQAHTNSGTSPVTFNMQGAVGEAETNRIQVISRYVDKVGTRIYDKLFRGGVSVIFGGTTATGVLTGHNRWNDAGAQDANGIYKLGNLGDIPVFRVPNEVCPNTDLVCVYKNRQLPEDVFLIIGTLLPLFVTDKLVLPGRNTEFGVASYGDMQILNKGYAEILRVENA